MHFSKSEKNSLIFSIVIILIIFILSANLAWINPDTRGAIKVLSVPLFWQYDVDAILELGTANYFPDIFKELPARVTRPLYPFIVNTLGNLLNFISPIKFDFIYFIVFSYFFMKLCFFTLAAICLIKICSYLNLADKNIKIILLIVFLNSILLKSITTFHTTELQILLPIISTYIYILFLEKKINILFFGLFLGTLFLSKNNYAIILTIFLHMIYFKKFKDSIVFLLLFCIPTILWTMFYQNYLNIDYSMTKEANVYGWYSFRISNLILYFKDFLTCIITFIKSYYIFFLIIIIYLTKIDLTKINKKFTIFFVLLTFSTIIQMIVSNKMHSIYMTKDTYFIYAIILGVIIYKISNNFLSITFNKINFLIFGLIVLFNSIVSLANFPLIHPDEQKVLLDHKVYIKKGIEKHEK